MPISGDDSVMELVRKHNLSGDDQVAKEAMTPTDLEQGNPCDPTNIAPKQTPVKCIGVCEKDLGLLGPKFGKIQCFKCGGESCNKCAGFSKPEITKFGDRKDIFWACETCVDSVSSGPVEGGDSSPATGGDIKTLVENSIKEVMPPIIEKCLNVVGANLTNSWSSLFGEEAFPHYDPAVTKNQAKNIAKEDEWLTVGKDGKALKQKLTLPKVLKKAAEEQKQEESRRHNIIIHKASEPEADNPQERKKEDESLVKNLLKHIGITQNYTKMFRLGVRDDEDDQQKRPIKVVFDDEKTVTNIMTNAKKLNNAPANLKALSIGYDMNKDEQEVCRKLVTEAKEMAKKCTTHRYRVVGRPGNMIIKGFPIQTKPN